MGIYNRFSQVYSRLFDDSLYYQWLQFTQDQVEDLLEKEWVDLACGDGKLAIYAKEYGYKIQGLDASSEMIAQAKEIAKDRATAIDFSVADMETFTIAGQPLDVVTLYCDSLLYITDSDQVERIFSHIYDQLNSGGYFIFDIIHPNYINEVYPGYSYVYEWDDVVFTWTSDQVRGENTIDHNLNIFVEEDSGLYQRHEEIHQQNVWPIADYQAALQKVGFNVLGITADFTDQAVTSTSKRVFFTCRKG